MSAQCEAKLDLEVPGIMLSNSRDLPCQVLSCMHSITFMQRTQWLMHLCLPIHSVHEFGYYDLCTPALSW